MAIAKVILNGETLMDVTSDTATANNMLSGIKATKNDGTKITGNIVSKSSTDLTVSGSTVTAPAGYYANAASKAVATTTHPNPTASIASSTGVVTASHTQGTGYVTSGTTTGTLSLTTQAGKTVTPTESAQTAVASYRWTTGPVNVAAISSTYVGTGVTTRSAADMTVAAQSVTAPAGYYSQAFTKAVTVTTHPNPTAGITSTTGVVTATHTQTAGYVVAGTTTGTLSLPILSAQTFYPSTGTQIISAGVWLTDVQRIASVKTNNLVSDYIRSGVTVTVGDTANPSRIKQVTGIYSGGEYGRYRAFITSALSKGRLSYNGSYYTDVNTGFNFNTDDTIILRAVNSGGYGVNINIDGVTVSNGGVNPTVYSYTPNTYFEADEDSNGLNIHTYVMPSGTSSITENGTYNVRSYKSVDVDIDIGYNIDQIALRSIGGNISGEVTKIHSGAFMYCESITTANFPLCTQILPSAFQYCTSLTVASFPLCTSIFMDCFSYCGKLTSISFPVCSVVSDSAFNHCTNLTSATFPSCISVGSYAFNECFSLSTISFPLCNYIGARAFGYCSNLTTANFPSCLFIGSSAFVQCYNLTTVNFSVAETIGSNAFAYCHSLNSANFPAVVSISASAFMRCYSITTLSFPAAKYIQAAAFSGCYNLISLYLLGSSVVSLANYNALQSTPISNYTTSTGGVYGSIFVPASLYNSYLTATYWTYYSSRFVSV